MTPGIRFLSVRFVAAMLLLTMIAGLPASAQQMNTRGMRLNHYSIKSDEAYAKEDWDKAIFYRELIAKMSPLDHGNYYNLACCYALNGDTDKAFDALDNSIRYGWCDGDHIKSDTDLDSLREDDRYPSMLDAVEACRKEAQFVYEPASPKGEGPVELLVALCGYGSNPREFGNEWIAVSDQLGIPVIALKGSGATRSTCVYGWHKGQDPNDLDVEGTSNLIDEAIKERGVKPENVVVVGFSQGGAVALELLGDYPGKYRGVLAIAGGYSLDVYRKWIANAKEAKLRVVMVAGELEKRRPHSPQTLEQIVDAGVKFKLEILPMEGHEMPKDGAGILVDAIQFLAEDD